MQQLEAFDQLKADITLFIEPVLTEKVSSPETSSQALGSAKLVKDWQKRIEEKRKELVGPLNEQVKMINEYAKKIMDPLNKAEAHLKTELVNWERELEKARRAEMARVEAERRAKEAELARELEAKQRQVTATEPYISPIEAAKERMVIKAEAERAKALNDSQAKQAERLVEQNKVSGVRQVWTFKVVDITKVPINFMGLDEIAVRQAIRDGAREIAGLEIFQETKIAIR